jgi:hypothetical protein
MSQYLKMKWAKLNTHTDASGNLCTCSVMGSLMIILYKMWRTPATGTLAGKSLISKAETAVTCALAVASPAGMDGMRSVVLVMSVDVEVAGPGLHIEPRDGFSGSKAFS